MNNNGGQIFSRLPYSKDNIKEFNKYWITPLETTIVEACKLFKLNYIKSTAKEIGSNLKKSITKKGVNVIEISINNKKDMSFAAKISNEVN